YQPSSAISLTTTAGFTYETQYIRTVRTRARGLLPGVETTNSGTVLDGSDVLSNFRDDALFANEQIVALDQRLTLIGGVRADRSRAHGGRTSRNAFPQRPAPYRFPDRGRASKRVQLRAGWAR